MWKIVVGFVVFAALALYILTKGGGNIDMSGEKHDVGATHEAAPPAPAALMQAASAPASGASQ